MTSQTKEAPTQEQEVKRNDGTPDDVTTDKTEPDDVATAEAEEMADEVETDDKETDFDNGFFGPYQA